MIIIKDFKNVTIAELEAWHTLNVDLVVDADNNVVITPLVNTH